MTIKTNQAFPMKLLLAVSFLLGCILDAVLARSKTVASEGNRNDPHAQWAAWGATLAGTVALAQWFLKTSPCDEETDSSLPVNTDKTMTYREDRGTSKLVPLIPEPVTSKKKSLTKYTMKEVAETQDKTLIIIDGRVYDVTSFVDKHPGGPLVIHNLEGKDCTDAFRNYHQARVYKNMLPAYLVGEVVDVPVYPHVEDFRAIQQELMRTGMFETDMRFYVKLTVWITFLFVTSLYLSLACTSMTCHLAGAAVMGIFWQQVAGIGHDLGHSSVTRNFQKDHLIGSSLGCAFGGISTGWWKRSHNTHHVVCNSVENDPDIQHMPIMAVSENIFSSPFWSTFHGKWVKMDAIARLFISYQHILFVPLMMVARFNLYAQSWIMLFTKEYHMYNRGIEAACLVFFISWVLAVALAQNTWTEAVLWVLVSHMVSGILHIQIVISHWSMETYNGRAYNDASDEWYITQLKTTMDVDCYEWLDWFHVGLQFQIEHHLYPMVPRHNLRKVRAMVKQVCKKHGIHYHAPSFLGSFMETYNGLKDTAMKARKGIYDKNPCILDPAGY